MKTYRSLFVCAAILLLLNIRCLAQNSLAARVDEFINAEMSRQHIPGLALAVIRDGQLVLSKGYGLANVEHHVPVTPATVFQSGSIGKQFTATAIMLLVEDGKVSLDDRISKYFPDLPETWQRITVRNLLTHTAGLGDFAPDFDLRRDYTEDEFLAAIKSIPLAHRTGEEWDYSNLGYVLSGILIRKLTGKFYGDFLRERVFNPLGMNTARIISEADIVENRAAGYRLEKGELKNQEWVSPSVNTTADGSLYLTVLDMAKWEAALSDKRLLKRSSLDQMWTPAKLNDGRQKAYGFGWHTNVIHGPRVLFHGGGWQGFKSFITRLPDERLTIVFFANLWQTNEHRLARGLLSIFHSEFALPAEQPRQDQEAKVTALVKKVLRQFSQGMVDFKLFTPAASAAMLPQRVGHISESLNSLSLPAAVISSIELVSRREEGEFRAYRYLLIDISQTLICTIKLTKDDKIADLQVQPDQVATNYVGKPTRFTSAVKRGSSRKGSNIGSTLSSTRIKSRPSTALLSQANA